MLLIYINQPFTIIEIQKPTQTHKLTLKINTQFALALTEDFPEHYKAYCIILYTQISKASKLSEQNLKTCCTST